MEEYSERSFFEHPVVMWLCFLLLSERLLVVVVNKLSSFYVFLDERNVQIEPYCSANLD